MVLGRRRRVLFLVRLKNRRVFSPSSLCLSCNAHGSGGILFVQGEKRVPRLMSVEDGPLMVPYIEGKIWGSLLPTKFKERMSSKMNSTRFPREPSVSKSVPLHKSTIEYASRILNQSALPQRGSINGDTPRMPKRQERAMGSRRNSGAREKARLNQP